MRLLQKLISGNLLYFCFEVDSKVMPYAHNCSLDFISSLCYFLMEYILRNLEHFPMIIWPDYIYIHSGRTGILLVI
jgi:hypothetical protein